MPEDDLKIGDRVRLTPLGALRNVGLAAQRGIIKGRTRGNGYYVQMDGNKSASTLHRSYIEPDDGQRGSDRVPSEFRRVRSDGC